MHEDETNVRLREKIKNNHILPTSSLVFYSSYSYIHHFVHTISYQLIERLKALL